jgi:4-hydroxy-tetrahydrodipicolinate reductase
MIRVVQMGLGPIGLAIADRALGEPGLAVVGAIDPDPRLAGRDLGELVGRARTGVVVRPDAEGLAGVPRPAVVLHATGSFLEEVAPQLLPLLERGLAVVSTCEELAYPFYRHAALARTLDEAARRAGVALLGSGVNPGFVMDKFVVTLMAACTAVRAVRVHRVVDAATRRASFQKKIGAGLSHEEFERRSAGGKMGHIGLAESAHMVADAMGVARERHLERCFGPVVTPTPLATDHLTIAPGRVAGAREEIVLRAEGVERVRMQIEMFVGAPRPHDTVVVEGDPRLEVEIASGVAGEAGTVAVVLSCVPLMAGLPAGLRTMLDVPLSPPAASRAARPPAAG